MRKINMLVEGKEPFFDVDVLTTSILKGKQSKSKLNDKLLEINVSQSIIKPTMINQQILLRLTNLIN